MKYWKRGFPTVATFTGGEGGVGVVKKWIRGNPNLVNQMNYWTHGLTTQILLTNKTFSNNSRRAPRTLWALRMTPWENLS